MVSKIQGVGTSPLSVLPPSESELLYDAGGSRTIVTIVNANTAAIVAGQVVGLDFSSANATVWDVAERGYRVRGINGTARNLAHGLFFIALDALATTGAVGRGVLCGPTEALVSATAGSTALIPGAPLWVGDHDGTGLLGSLNGSVPFAASTHDDTIRVAGRACPAFLMESVTADVTAVSKWVYFDGRVGLGNTIPKGTSVANGSTTDNLRDFLRQIGVMQLA